MSIQLVKSVVIGLGVLIVIGIGLLVYGLSSRGSDRDRAGGGRKPAVEAPSALVPAFGELRVALPDGCSVVEMQIEDDRMYLRTGPVGQCERVVVIDAVSGRTLGSLLIRP